MNLQDLFEVASSKVQTLGFMLTCHRDTSEMIRVFVLHPLLAKRIDVYGLSRCVILGDIRNQKNNRVFRCLESGPSNLWSLIRFCISLWASTSKNFCN